MYVTQTRPVNPDKKAQWYMGSVRTDYPWTSPLETQVTTSWRTGRSASGESNNDDEALLSARSQAEVFSQLRKEYGESRSKRPFDTGHTFSTQTDSIVCPTIDESFVMSGVTYRWSGPAMLNPSTAGLPNAGNSWYNGPSSNTGYYGPEAIRRTAPTNPNVSLLQAFAELRREGLPSLPGSSISKDRVKRLRDAGDEYLNVEFGWKPLLNDVKDTYNTIAKYNNLVQQYQRNSGKFTRRGHRFPEIITTEHRRSGTANFAFNNGQPLSTMQRMFQGSVATGPLSETTKTTRRVWFKGEYTYLLPEMETFLGKMRGIESFGNRLFGLRLTPEVLWELSPWSWLSDWYLNLGTNIANASLLSSDGLVLRYGYLMVETITEHTMSITGPVTNSGIRGPWVTTFKRHKKERFRATPYGFGSNPASFTGRQWAILAALGLTKGDKQLRLGD